jgi:hypothetical protein
MSCSKPVHTSAFTSTSKIRGNNAMPCPQVHFREVNITAAAQSMKRLFYGSAANFHGPSPRIDRIGTLQGFRGRIASLPLVCPDRPAGGCQHAAAMRFPGWSQSASVGWRGTLPKAQTRGILGTTRSVVTFRHLPETACGMQYTQTSLAGSSVVADLGDA